MTQFKVLSDIPGDRITTDIFERQFYAGDLAPLPKIFSLLFKSTPDAIARPVNTKEVSEIMKFAYSNRIPVTPRAAGSSGIYGCVPTRGGILIDMKSLDSKIEIDKNANKVVVHSGVVWKDLEHKLNRKDLSLMTYPSSAPSSTVGGWLSSPGCGIGTLKYGRVYEQVLSIEVVLPNGEVMRVSKDEEKFNWFLGSDGTTGIITKVELMIRKIPEALSAHLLNIDNIEKLCKVLQDVAKLKPFYLSYSDRIYTKMLKEAGKEPHTDSNCIAFVVFDGSKKEVTESVNKLENIVTNNDVKEAPRQIAMNEWEDNLHFYPMRIKRAGPTLLAGDLLIPLKNLSVAIEKLKKLGIEFGIEGTIPLQDYAVLMPMYLTDERKFLEFVFSLRHVKSMNDIAISIGGMPYGVGMWNLPFASRMMDIKEKRRIKKQLDPGNIMNPDKHTQAVSLMPRIILNPFVFSAAMLAAGIAAMPLKIAGIIKN
ncbi:MAG: hypothetical protein CVU81_00070 [Euryarchaeota archaeon HGW-Euryarchaeota-1]|nr:MAG: hypothetical protein CVU81_00070 [Euryarchaeota archaeon HGW-Euryarchaeota-1]